ncbi:MAG TPA: hypothetical protein VEA38_11660 [Terriglobales bacterium]|nr:hypothetical protein [Terriglobales bacterium]
MGWLRKVGRKYEKALRANIKGTGRTLSALGVPMSTQAALGRVIGGRNAKRILRGVPPRTLAGPVVDAVTSAPDRCAPGGQAGLRGSVKPFTFKSRVTVAAGAKAIDTDLGNFFAAANVDFITTDGEVPWEVTIYEVGLIVSMREAAAATENPASIVGAGYLIHTVNGVEKARYGLEDFKPLVTQAGIVTSGGAAQSFQLITPLVKLADPWDFDPDETQALNLRLTSAITTVGAIDMAMMFKGTRVAG